VVSLEGDNLVVFYYPSAPEIWHDKRGASLEGDTSREATPLIRPDFRCTEIVKYY
jgi:hypothetical protein